MRAAFILFAVALAGAAGCGDDATTGMMTPDMAAVGDMSVPLDMLQLSCAGVVRCIAECGENTVCRQSCIDAATADGRGKFNAFDGCVAQSCSGLDGGTASCASPTDSSIACTNCLEMTAIGATTSGQACHAEYADCLAH
jgi:hypothetical protein